MKIILGNLLPLSMIAIASLAKCPWYASTSSRRVPRTPARGARPPSEFCIWNALNQLYAYVICVATIDCLEIVSTRFL